MQRATGNWTRPGRIVEIVYDAQSPKPLLLAAIGAVGSIRPTEAGRILIDLADSDETDLAGKGHTPAPFFLNFNSQSNPIEAHRVFTTPHVYSGS